MTISDKAMIYFGDCMTPLGAMIMFTGIAWGESEGPLGLTVGIVAASATTRAVHDVFVQALDDLVNTSLSDEYSLKGIQNRRLFTQACFGALRGALLCLPLLLYCRESR